MSRSHSQFQHVWRMPLLLGGLIVFGLLAALLGTGAWHWAAWIALCVPLATAVRFACFPRS